MRTVKGSIPHLPPVTCRLEFLWQWPGEDDFRCFHRGKEGKKRRALSGYHEMKARNWQRRDISKRGTASSRKLLHQKSLSLGFFLIPCVLLYVGEKNELDLKRFEELHLTPWTLSASFSVGLIDDLTQLNYRLGDPRLLLSTSRKKALCAVDTALPNCRWNLVENQGSFMT